MKKIILLFAFIGLLALNAFTQEAFVLNRTYPNSWVVWYPSYGTFYRAVPNSPFVANKTPNLDPARWARYYYPTIPTPTPTPTPVPTPVPVPVDVFEVERKMLLKVDSLSKRLNTIEKDLLIFGAGFDVKRTDTGVIVNLKPIK